MEQKIIHPPTPGLNPRLRSLILFMHFFLVVTAYYQVKPASRTLFITYVGNDNFPWIWIASAVTLGALLPFYSSIIRRFSTDKILAWSCGCFAFCMLIFRLLLIHPTMLSVAIFYIIIDIYSVVLVEQFWSHASSLHKTNEGKQWYGIIGSGGVLGGIAGSALASWLIDNVGLKTIDLLIVSALFLLVFVVLIPWLNRRGYFAPRSIDSAAQHLEVSKTMKELVANRYVVLITLLILFSQLLEPIIEYQFMAALAANISELDQRTAYLSSFFVVLGVISLGINLLITPIVLRYLGTIAGLCAQPLLIIITSSCFFLAPSLNIAGTLKIADRGISYSINRAAKELLYIPLAQMTIYRVKALIDMFGYRLFKILSSLMILGVSKVTLPETATAFLFIVTLLLCAVWLYFIRLVSREYQSKLAAADPARSH